MTCSHKLKDKEDYCNKCEVYKKPCKELFHVFTNNNDEWLNNKKEALTLAKQWYKEYGCVRVYHETEWDEVQGIFDDGDCIYSKGEYPY